MPSRADQKPHFDCCDYCADLLAWFFLPKAVTESRVSRVESVDCGSDHSKHTVSTQELSWDRDRDRARSNSEKLDDVGEDCEIAVHPFTDEDVQPAVATSPPPPPHHHRHQSEDQQEEEEASASSAETQEPRHYCPPPPSRPSLDVLHRASSSASIKSAFTAIIKTDINESMFIDDSLTTEQEIVRTLKISAKSPKELLGWKIELLEGMPFQDIRIVVAVKKVPFKHSMFCLFSLLGADPNQMPHLRERPPETEWCRLKREKEGRPFRLLRKVAV